jgi:hypothetical protein
MLPDDVGSNQRVLWEAVDAVRRDRADAPASPAFEEKSRAGPCAAIRCRWREQP